MTLQRPRDRTFALRRKVGALASALLTPEVRGRALASLEALAPLAIAMITDRVHEMSAPTEHSESERRELLFHNAHQIRGVSGTFGMPELGAIADSLCLYLDDLPSDAPANDELIAALVNALHSLLNQPGDGAAATLSAQCQTAVRAVRAREGRSAELS